LGRLQNDEILSIVELAALQNYPLVLKIKKIFSLFEGSDCHRVKVIELFEL